jgi:hypothetical protein
MATAFVLGGAALGAATLPRQLHELSRALAPAGDPLRDAQHAMMWSGLLRFVLVDRLVPPPTLLLAAILLVLVAEPVLALPRDRRPALWSVAVLGLAPILVQRIGEAVITYLPMEGVVPVPGQVLNLPHQLVTGPLLLWPQSTAPPWLHILDARLNLISIWSLALWTWGLRCLDGRRLEAWHVGVPLATLVGAGLLSWMFTQPVVLLILGRP